MAPSNILLPTWCRPKRAGAYEILFIKNGTYFTALTLPKDVSVLGDGTMQTISTLKGTITFPESLRRSRRDHLQHQRSAITMDNDDLVSGITVNGNDSAFHRLRPGIERRHE